MVFTQSLESGSVAKPCNRKAASFTFRVYTSINWLSHAVFDSGDLLFHRSRDQLSNLSSICFLGILLVSRRLERWLKYRFDYKIKRNILFLLDVIVVATTLAAVHLSLTLTFLAIFGLVYTSINNKISF